MLIDLVKVIILPSALILTCGLGSLPAIVKAWGFLAVEDVDGSVEFLADELRSGLATRLLER